MQKTLFLIVTAFLFLAGCTKDNDPQPVSKAKLLTRSWKVQLVAATSIASNNMVAFYTRDASSNITDHSTHIVQYNADGTYLASATSTTNTVTGKWELIENESKLVITPPNHVPQRTATIENLSETQFGWFYSILEPSQGATLEKSMYDKLKDTYHEDVSKGVKITYRYIPY